jgi:hypothetical protein
MTDLDLALNRLDARHHRALLWFYEQTGEVVGWPEPMSNGTYLATHAKGIYKPKWTSYALSVRESLRGPYPDLEPDYFPDGTWTYRYYQEGFDSEEAKRAYTNRGAQACMDDGVPVGVFRQIQNRPSNRYQILGVATVEKWEDGYFVLHGFSKTGKRHVPNEAR